MCECYADHLIESGDSRFVNFSRVVFLMLKERVDRAGYNALATNNTKPQSTLN